MSAQQLWARPATPAPVARQCWVRTDEGTFRAGLPVLARWRADAMVGCLLERPEVLNAWHAPAR
jgi:hypothetical protein